MSVSVSAVPFFLLFTVGKGVIEFIKMSSEVNQDINAYKEKQTLHIGDKTLENLYNKEFSTTIMDKDVLLKTLKEHGATNIEENGNDITCDCEAFHLFFKKNKDEAYTLKISYNNGYKLDELVENLGNEYTSNAQEISYNKIKERLEEQNLEIEEEEIYDDNTIVLTVNLE